MALRPKLTALKKLVGKLSASALRSGVGAGWLAEWRLNDLTTLVLEAVNPPGGYAAALLVVARQEARRLGRSNDPRVRAALDALTRAVGRWLNPPPGADRKELDDAVGEAIGPATDWVLPAWGVNPDAPDAWTPPPNGRPPRLTDLPPEWFPADTPTTGDGVNDNEPA